MLSPKFVDHLVFRVADLERTELFYTSLLGSGEKENDYVVYSAGDTLIFFTCSPRGVGQKYDKEAIGLNHIALGLRSKAELEMVRAQLDSAGVAHSGIKMWKDGRTPYIWLDDPDGIRVEFWVRAKE